MGDDARFGAWLKHHRRALDLSREDLARQISCSISLVEKIETGERRPSRQIAALLAERFGVAAEQLPEFISFARSIPNTSPAQPTDHASSADVQSTVSQLPRPIAALIGRKHELAELDALLARSDCRLINLVGPGGIGKTQLALQAARQAQQFEHGVYFVALAPVAAPELLVTAIAKALGFTFFDQTDPATQLIGYLRKQRVLLVLDNMEHLLAGATVVLALIAEAPDVKILVTSRERLNLRGEWIFDVAGLPFPHAGDAVAEDSDAIQLFLQTATRVRLGYTALPDDLVAIARICRLVEGLPLAIELAAAWMRLLPPNEIVREMHHSLRFLSTSGRDLPERHRSIEAVFEHSWRLLAPHAQRALSRLAIFRGRFSRTAAESVGHATLAILDTLTNASLLRVYPHGEYDLHELIRQGAFAKLANTAELDAARIAHLQWCVLLAEQTEETLHGPMQLRGFDTLEHVHDDLRAALVWALAQNPTGSAEAGAADPCELRLRLVGALWWFWFVRGHLHEGRAWLDRVLNAPGPQSEAARAKALLNAGWLTQEEDQNNGRTAAAYLEEALRLFEAVSNPRGAAWALSLLGGVSAGTRATELLQLGLERFRGLSDTHGIAWTLVGLGRCAWLAGDPVRAHRLLAEGRQLHIARGDIRNIAWSTWFLAQVTPDRSAATALCQQSLALHRQLGDPQGVSTALNSLGWLANGQGNRSQAIAFFEEALALHRHRGDLPQIARAYNHLGELARAQADYSRAEHAYQEALVVCQEANDQRMAATVLWNLGWVARSRADLIGAAAHYAASAALERSFENSRGLALSLVGVAGIAIAHGQFCMAARSYAAATAILGDIRAQLEPIDQRYVDTDLAALTAQLDQSQLAMAWDAGSALSVEQALEYALAEMRT